MKKFIGEKKLQRRSSYIDIHFLMRREKFIGEGKSIGEGKKYKSR